MSVNAEVAVIDESEFRNDYLRKSRSGDIRVLVSFKLCKDRIPCSIENGITAQDVIVTEPVSEQTEVQIHIRSGLCI